MGITFHMNTKVREVQDVDGDGMKDRVKERTCTEDFPGECPPTPPNRLILSSGRKPSEVGLLNGRGDRIKPGDTVLILGSDGNPIGEGTVQEFSSPRLTGTLKRAACLFPPHDEPCQYSYKATLNAEVMRKGKGIQEVNVRNLVPFNQQGMKESISGPDIKIATFAINRLAQDGKISREELMDIASNEDFHDDVRLAATNALDLVGHE
jgi:hypothetical protein